MKYLIEFWPKEPFAENMKKVLEIEAERTKKGEAFTKYAFPIHYLLNEQHAIMIVDVDSNKLAKWEKVYSAVMSYKVSPLMDRSEFDKL
jgi:hypothetical protein